MIEINNKSWDKIKFKDVEEFITKTDESFFVEYKSDSVDNKTISNEISAFSNTYGGYIFIGVEDDKSITGCNSWTEERVTTLIHDTISPTPNFNVKKIADNGKNILIIRVNEGLMPPYITNRGHIFERLSSSSCVVKDSNKITLFYNKRKENENKIHEKISINKVTANINNLYGYVDIGFSITCSKQTRFSKKYSNFDFKQLSDYLKEVNGNDYSISRITGAIMISLGNPTCSDNGKRIPVVESLGAFMCVYVDGSAKMRIILTGDVDTDIVNLNQVIYPLLQFKKIYSLIFGKELHKIFISAQKYEQINVIKQFYPYLDYNKVFGITNENLGLEEHRKKYGNNLIFTSFRYPTSGFEIIDEKYIKQLYKRYNNKKLLNCLFSTDSYNLGFIERS